MARDIVGFLAAVIAAAGLGYSIGHQHGADAQRLTCPAKQGELLAYSVQRATSVDCVYVAHTRGMAHTTRSVKQ